MLEALLPVSRSLPREPYLFFKYLAQELRAAPSFSPGGGLSGELSRDFRAWDDRLRDNSDPVVPDPYFDAKYAEGDAVVGDVGSS